MNNIKAGISNTLNNDQNFSKVLVATFVFYLYKTAFWPLTYLFVACYILLLILFLIKFNWKFNFKGFFQTFLPPLIIAGIMLLAFLLNFKITVTVLKDFMLIAVLFSLFYFLYWNRSTLNQEFPLSFTYNFIIITTSIISAINLIYLLSASQIPAELLIRFNISDGTTLANDYNFYSLFILFGLIIINFSTANYTFSTKYPKWTIHLLNLLFILNILFSSSRRGIIILVLLGLIYVVQYFVHHNRELTFGKVFKNSTGLLLTLIVFLLLGVVFFQKVPKQKISIIIYRYATILGLDDYKTVEKFLWERDPKTPLDKNFLIDEKSFDPDYGYWTQASDGTIIKNVETPYGNGIKLEKTGNPISFSLFYVGPTIIYYAEHSYRISFKIKFMNGDFNSFYLGWWADDGAKGISNTLVLDKTSEPVGDGWYQCTAQYTFIDNHVGLPGFINTVADQTSFIIADFELIDLNSNPDLPRYEFEYKGDEEIYSWLNKINSPWNDFNLINNGDFSHGLAFWKYSADALTINLTDIENKKCALISRGNGNGADWSLYYVGRNLSFIAENEYQLAMKIKPLYPKSVPFNVGFWVDEGEGHKIALPQQIEYMTNGWIEIKARYTFKKNHGNLFFPINSQINNSSFYITDIKLINLTQPQYQTQPIIKNKSDSVNYVVDNFDKGRASRLKFAKELWNTKYSWYNKLIGNGFDYYDWYVEKYPNDKTRADYPHNPLISVLFYSGILGLLFYLWLLYKVFSLYIRSVKNYGVPFFCFLITFFFSFFSGSSPFDPPVMGFFILLPFFINYVYRDKIVYNGHNN